MMDVEERQAFRMRKGELIARLRDVLINAAERTRIPALMCLWRAVDRLYQNGGDDYAVAYARGVMQTLQELETNPERQALWVQTLSNASALVQMTIPGGMVNGCIADLEQNIADIELLENA